MTKEEAIDIIKSECYIFNPLNFDRSTMVNTALDMAVKALKQEPCPCEKCVSLDELHDLLATWLNDNLSDETQEVLEIIDYKIDDLPFVQPVALVAKVSFDKTELKKIVDNAIVGVLSETQKPKVGRWKITHDDIMQWWACSECGEPCLKGRYGGDFFSDFCPSCGARMVETEEMGFPAKVVREAITTALQGRK